MTFQDFTARIVGRLRQSGETLHISKSAVEATLKAMAAETAAVLAEGGRVQLPGLGVFETQARAARQGRNPRTGEAIAIPARKAATFTPGKALKETINA
ncbi:HU family DNA-binding protein [Megalodesulfovibrio gigas]|uniref:Histone family protein DNA-binding protein n=1 Tax=Megalodesulfovibrio gigas (strain ATCC 19364 / DSM 1382 / NCIMB 9332 / VKM B-1759) TaxID=1121448 RepID=T2GE29_MEGG1|nr:HU family DNA-binding protein [Megalodesulfovibrio gigas]AGW14147.1 hypothetical protein DGI_2398 [Megalodesulfovibrio gigas DSM 1382 = ATCC 19364]